MKIGAAVKCLGNVDRALDGVIAAATAALAGEAAHFGLVTLTNHFEDEVEKIVQTVRERTGVEHLIGCTAEGVIGPTEEVERQPGISLWLAHLPDVRVRGFHLHPEDLQVVDSAEELRRLMRTKDVPNPHFVLLAEPFFTPYVIGLLDAVDKVFPGRPVFGGMASGSEAPGQAALVLNDDVFREGAVGVSLSGEIEIQPVVSQGCRPIGKPFVITAAEKNVIKQLGGRPALEVFNDVFEAAPKSERDLIRHGLFVGRAINEYQDQFRAGDFLIRNVVGADKDSQAIVIGDIARVGTTIQFHVRDRESAASDLRGMLGRQPREPAGALVFSCNGRGTRMFPQPNHDLDIIHDVLGRIPVGGLFCAGEIGPVGGHTFVHGHTASIAIFNDR